MPKILEKPPADRAWYQRLTIIMGALCAASSSLEPAGIVPPGTTEATTVALAQIGTAFGALIGVYRQIAN